MGRAHKGVVVVRVLVERAVHERVALGGVAAEQDLGRAGDAALRVDQQRGGQVQHGRLRAQAENIVRVFGLGSQTTRKPRCQGHALWGPA